MMLRDLAKAAHMPPAKAHRYLVSLINLGLVEQIAQSGRYDLGPFCLELGLARQDRIDAIGVAVSAIEELREKTQESVVLSVWTERGPVIVRVLVESRRPAAIRARVGAVLPITTTASGLAFAAFLPRELTADLIATELQRNRKASADGPTSRKQLDSMLDEVRRHQIARAEGTMTRGLNAICAPVFDHTTAMVLAITVTALEAGFDADWNGPVAQALRRAAENVSRRLGYFSKPQK